MEHCCASRDCCANSPPQRVSTPAGEGKTTTSIGLAQALAQLGESVCLALREPSLGPFDTGEEIAVVRKRCRALGVPFAVSDHYARGGAGALDLAREVMAHAERRSKPFRPLYEWNQPVPDKILAVAQRMYGARSVVFSKTAERDLQDIQRLGYDRLPVCIAKTPTSLTDDPSRRGRPTDFDVTVRGIQINAGAGFLVVLTGDILRMPGLPQKPLAESIDVRNGTIVGLR